METMIRTDESPEILFHLRWVAKIAFSVGLLAAIGLAIMLYELTDSTGTSYGELIKSHSITQHHLGPALLIGGCVLLGFTAVLTWLIALYSSFRTAGPLFRMSQNLQNSISHGPGKPVPIRDSDRLHLEAALLADSLSVLTSHYEDLRAIVDRALGQQDAAETTENQRLAICAQLKKSIERARL
jgi:hypothetical protein